MIFCSWEKIFRIIRIKFNGSKFFMLIVHAIFGLVAICHFGGLMLGYEYNNVKLGEGKKYSFDNGYEIEIKSVQYINDYKILINAPKYLTKDQFDYKKNFADIVLSKNGKEVCRADVYQLIPLSFNDIQVTLKGFIASPESGEKIASKNLKPWVNVSVSRNPVLKFFLALYPLMIIGISIYLIMTWKTSIKNKFENSKLES